MKAYQSGVDFKTTWNNRTLASDDVRILRFLAPHPVRQPEHVKAIHDEIFRTQQIIKNPSKNLLEGEEPKPFPRAVPKSQDKGTHRVLSRSPLATPKSLISQRKMDVLSQKTATSTLQPVEAAREDSLTDIEKTLRELELLRMMRKQHKDKFKRLVREKTTVDQFSEWYSQMSFKNEMNAYEKQLLAEKYDVALNSTFSPDINSRSRVLAANYDPERKKRKFKERTMQLKMKQAQEESQTLPVRSFNDCEFRVHMTKINTWNHAKKDKQVNTILGSFNAFKNGTVSPKDFQSDLEKHKAKSMERLAISWSPNVTQKSARVFTRTLEFSHTGNLGQAPSVRHNKLTPTDIY
jgi:hypothetical protein